MSTASTVSLLIVALGVGLPSGASVGPSLLDARSPVPVAQEVTLPWPSVAMGDVVLPFGLRWFEEGSREKVRGFGEPECTPAGCRWTADRPEGTLFLEQSYHVGSLVGLRLEYILVREAGLPYVQRVRELREKMERDEWVVVSLEDPLMGIVLPQQSFRGESKNSRVEVHLREGEHSVTVSLDLRSK